MAKGKSKKPVKKARKYTGGIASGRYIGMSRAARREAVRADVLGILRHSTGPRFSFAIATELEISEQSVIHAIRLLMQSGQVEKAPDSYGAPVPGYYRFRQVSDFVGNTVRV